MSNPHPYDNEPSVHTPIIHAPAVAVGRFNDGVATLWAGFVLILTGLHPVITLLRTLDNPRHMTTMGDWLLIAIPAFIGIMMAGYGVKEKGYQQESIRKFGICTFIGGVIIFASVPLTASLLYALGAGN